MIADGRDTDARVYVIAGDPRSFAEAFERESTRVCVEVRDAVHRLDRAFRNAFGDLSDAIEEFTQALQYERERKRGYALFAPCAMVENDRDVGTFRRRDLAPPRLTTWKRLTTAREPGRSTATGWHPDRSRR